MDCTPLNWVLLRGLARESGHWHDFAELLAAAPGHRVHPIDMPGTGDQLNASSPWSVHDIVEHCRGRWLHAPLPQVGERLGEGDDLRKSLEPKTQRPNQPRWAILGVSLGGMAAMDWCQRHPGDFQRAVLINSSDRQSGWPWQRLRLWTLWQGLKIAAAGSARRVEQLALEMTANLPPGPRYDRILDQREQTRKDRPITAATAFRQTWAACFYPGPVRLPIPALVLASTADDMVSPLNSYRLAERFGATLRIHDRAGHDLTTDAPHWCIEQIMDWLAE